jgi:hypothetical protein
MIGTSSPCWLLAYPCLPCFDGGLRTSLRLVISSGLRSICLNSVIFFDDHECFDHPAWQKLCDFGPHNAAVAAKRDKLHDELESQTSG